MNDLHYNPGFGTQYLRINGIYYQRTASQPWHVIPEEQAGSLAKWHKMHFKQHRAFTKALKEQGLIGD